MFVARAVAVLLTGAALLAAPALASAQSTTTTTVTPPAVQPVHGQTATVSATVANTTAPGTDPTGTVRFSLDGAQLGVVPLANGTAQIQTPQLTAGLHTVLAEYVPGAGFLASQGTANVNVSRAATTTVVRIVPSNGVAGQDLDVEAVVTPTTPALGTPTGGVSVVIDGMPVGMDSLDPDGVARGTTGLTAAAHTVSVTYQGNASYEPSGGSASVTIVRAGTVIVLTASPNPAALNQLVTFSATVDSIAPSMWWPSGVMTGAIDGVPVAGSAVLIGTEGEGAGFARSFTTPGAHLATVHFAGDQDFLSADAGLQVTVTGATYADPLPTARRPLAARGLTLKATPRRDRRAPYRFAVSGTLQLPNTVSKANGCGGKVNVEAKVKAKRVARKAATVTSACTFKAAFTVPRKGSVSITAVFAGNASVSGTNARAIKVKAG